MVRGGWYTPVDSALIPTGEIGPVTGTVFDLTGGAALGQIINSVPGSLDNPGFDHNFVISRCRVMSSSSSYLPFRQRRESPFSL